MPTRKRVQPNEKLPLKLTADERKLVLERLTCLDQEIEQIVRDAATGQRYGDPELLDDGYFAHSTKTAVILQQLASLNPSTLACQHGSAFRGAGAGLRRELAAILDKELRAELG